MRDPDSFHGSAAVAHCSVLLYYRASQQAFRMGGYKINNNCTCPDAAMSRWCEGLRGVLD